MNRIKLKNNYDDACNAYVRAFCRKHGYSHEESRWVLDEPGGSLDVNGVYFIDMQTVKDDIDLCANKNEFAAWYEYCTEMHALGASSIPNFRSWIRGCPRKSPAEIERLAASAQRIRELKEELEKEVERITEPAK